MERMKDIIEEMNSYDENGVLYNKPIVENTVDEGLPMRKAKQDAIERIRGLIGDNMTYNVVSYECGTMYTRDKRRSKQEAVKRIREIIDDMNEYDDNGVMKYSCMTCDEYAYFRCSRCKTTKYCSSNCQSTDWNRHKRKCMVA